MNLLCILILNEYWTLASRIKIILKYIFLIEKQQSNPRDISARYNDLISHAVLTKKALDIKLHRSNQSIIKATLRCLRCFFYSKTRFSGL